jgi:hypothetical protein
LNDDLEMIKKKGLYELEDELKTNSSYKRHEYLGLRIFDFMSNWEVICKAEASLCYALKTNNLKYCNTQLYPNY